MSRKWFDDPKAFEEMRQNFTSAFFHNGPNMTLPDMAEKLCELRDELQALREENERLKAMAFRPKSTHETGCLCIQCQPF